MKLDTSTDPHVGYRPPGALDIASALAPYAGPFTRRDAAHLYRRAGFGGTPAEIEALATAGAGPAVEAFLHPKTPEVAFTDFPDDYDPIRRSLHTPSAQTWFLDRMLRARHPLAEKMAFFWHGHFATSYRKVPAPMMVAQINIFRTLGLGDFRSLLLATSKDPAMLVWLDNRANVKAHPNENFAREVMELFTLGLGNFSEADVRDGARAFTGWTIGRDGGFADLADRHDEGTKTVLGRSGNLGGEDVIAAIVAQPAHQRFISRKLLEYFVYSDPEPELVDALAHTYASSGGNIATTVGTIFRSNVFFSQRAYRSMPKSPVEFVIGTLRFMEVGAIPRDTPQWLARMGQEILAPPNVKGWDGGPMWVNTTTLLARLNYVDRIVKASAAHARPELTIDPATYPELTPDAIVRRAGGLAAGHILETMLRDALQDDATSDVRATLLAYLDSKGSSAPAPLGPENYQDKIRGALALVLQLPSNQLN